MFYDVLRQVDTTDGVVINSCKTKRSETEFGLIRQMSHAASARDAKRPLPENSNCLVSPICPFVLFGVDPVFSVTTSTVPRPL